ncbi:transporter substrate-binding domain-containing protein [Dethiosulfovibrio sp. F2B]|uniref:transporter substrate-binding domain-containing protein n=1 Tax=Dethiosulfovibrio faecalis TaxID=2720018 RepID=UPI001F267171|nr:transporter substrate-binding domain-containing protein [Dethiosulfovibrio faecalis]MCF4151567.1 transporter substrate-binding domain-containing protein [Dethiosulfovibrio faecalis]
MKRTIFLFLLLSALCVSSAQGEGLKDIRKRGELRHLGVPYAHFVSGSGDGLDVELMRRFASFLGVKYSFVPTDWENLIPDLLGRDIKKDGSLSDAKRPIRGDLIASGLTVLDWRKKLIDFSSPTFTTQVWLVTRANNPIRPIKPSGYLTKDIEETKELIRGRSLMGCPGTCLDPNLYGLRGLAKDLITFEGNLNDLVPALISGRSELVLLDVPDVLVGLASWPGQIKVIGPISQKQEMAVAFPKESDLREEFERFFSELVDKGEYSLMVEEYYPSIREFP